MVGDDWLEKPRADMLTSAFMDVLMLIWYIMVVTCTAKIMVENGCNNGMGCCHVYIYCLYIFKDFFNFGVSYSG